MNRYLPYRLMFLILCLLPQPLWAFDLPDEYLSPPESLGLIHHIYVYTNDQVTGGCWTNVDAVLNRAKAKLEQAGIATYGEPFFLYNPFAVTLEISATGYKLDAVRACVGALRMQIMYDARENFGSKQTTGKIWSVTGGLSPFQFGTIFNSATDRTLNEQILELVDQEIDKLIVAILSGRRNVVVKEMIEALPNWFSEPPPSQKRFKEMMEQSQ